MRMSHTVSADIRKGFFAFSFLFFEEARDGLSFSLVFFPQTSEKSWYKLLADFLSSSGKKLSFANTLLGSLGGLHILQP